MNTEFPILETERFLLRQFTEPDLENVYKGLSDPKVTRYYGVSFSSLEDTRSQIEWFRNLEHTNTGIWWAICSKSDDSFLGGIGYNNHEKDHRKAEIGFWLLHEYWKQGVISEVFSTICQYGFDKMKLHRIEGYVETGNANSKMVLVKQGFEKEGTMKDCEMKDSQFISLEIYALINPIN
jgi:ribosomal-protein-alanine N-acetyltransferase